MKGTRNKPLTDKQLQKCKDMLLAEKERIVNSMSSKSEQISFSHTETKDSVDTANENILLSQTTRFTNRESLFLKKIQKSLTKLEEGEYGICEDCGYHIPFTRLKARLTSDLCIVCKEESEQSERQSVFGRKSKSLGKTLTVAGARI